MLPTAPPSALLSPAALCTSPHDVSATLRMLCPAVQDEIDTDSIGNVVVKKADELEVAVTVLARHT